MTRHLPADAQMTAAEWVTAREFLGLTGDWVASGLSVGPRTVRRWEAGDFTVPADAQSFLETLEHYAQEAVDELVTQLHDLPDPGVILYRNDATYRNDAAARGIGTAYPARWHRQIVARARARRPASIAVAFFDDERIRTGTGTWLRFTATVANGAFVTRYEQPTLEVGP